MPEWIDLPEKYVMRGKRMREGQGWRLVSPTWQTGFKATLVRSFRTTGGRLAIFRIREASKKAKGA